MTENQEAEQEVEWIIGPPRTKEDIIRLRDFHGSFYGVCAFCGAAGHIDVCMEIGRYTVDVCDACREQNPDEE